jgi:hypothetical protein
MTMRTEQVHEHGWQSRSMWTIGLGATLRVTKTGVSTRCAVIGNKSVLVGAVQRGGIVLEHTDSNSRAILDRFFNKHTDDSTTIYTEEHASYWGVKQYRVRDSVRHRAEEYVRGDVRTNSMEGVRSLFKRSIIGSFHQVFEEHLDRVLDELEWRFNNRENPDLFRDTLIKLLNVNALEYKS